MNQDLLNKYRKLKEIISGFKTVLVAYSGGLDSAFLLYACVDTLGPDAVTAVRIATAGAAPALAKPLPARPAHTTPVAAAMAGSAARTPMEAATPAGPGAPTAWWTNR